jgi:tripeptidyl-peptidase II
MDEQREHLQWDLIPQHATGIESFHEIRRCQANEKSANCKETSTSLVTIGILDTGVDPAIFQGNPDVTLIESIDCTSSGDVDVTEEVTIQVVSNTNDSDFYYEVVGHTGRTLKLSKDWNIKPFPSSETAAQEIDGEDSKLTVRIGIKRGYDLFPKSLTELCRKNSVKRKQRDLNVHVASLHQKLAEWNDNSNKNGDAPSAASIAQRDDILAQLEILQNFVNDSDDPGPVYDCVVFWDGSVFRCVIDVEECGDLRSLKPMASYGIDREYGTFSIFSTDDHVFSLNFVVQVYNHGTLLSIVTDCSPHGTHVAQIAATTAVSSSFFGSCSTKVQLVSFKIGDPRLGTMETGTSLIRAIQLASSVKYHCDIINISYGEAVVHPRSGERFLKLVDDCVWKRNTLIVCAAGNNGPALTTVNAPGGTLSSCISVAAVVTPNMKDILYSMVPSTLSSEDGPSLESSSGVDSIDKKFVGKNSESFDTTYTWSSVGPTADGDWGVTITAPGGAISSVPEWCLTKSQLMNGTSMACPHATGCIALLIGACKMEGIPVSFVRIRRALENTSFALSNRSPLEQGSGLIQVDKAWEYILINRDDVTENIGFDVEIVSPIFCDKFSPRGIYIRHADSCMTEQLFSVKVIPKFLGNDATSRTEKMLNVQFNTLLETQCSWIRTAGKVVLTNAGGVSMSRSTHQLSLQVCIVPLLEDLSMNQIASQFFLSLLL